MIGDQDRLDAIHAMPCAACVKQKCRQPSRTEAHHWVGKGYRKHSGGHQTTLPLCGWHHRGDTRGCFDAPRISQATVKYGPSLAVNKKEFVAAYGTELELLAETDRQLEAA